MPDFVAHIVDDDADAREALAFLLSSAGIPVASYHDAASFLAIAQTAAGAVITDVRMPGIDGIELVRRLAEMNVTIPVIVMTGHADVPLAVAAMKAGVQDFIEKPYDTNVMILAIRNALNGHDARETRERERTEFRQRFRSLSARETEVLGGIVAGGANKTIARDLGISPRTVEIYRANVMTKMKAHSLSELVRMALVSGVT